MNEHQERPRGPGSPSSLVGLAPVVGLAVLAVWAGTMPGGARHAGSVTVAVVVLLAALGAGEGWADALRLGRAGRFLVWALWGAVAASVWASPVPRTGWLAACLVPAFFLAPAAVARTWASPRARLWGAAGIALVTMGVSAWALLGRAQGDPRAAQPLGHHLLLGVVLLAVWPVGVLPLVGRPRLRLLGLAAWGLAAMALFATGSLAVWIGYLAQHLVWTVRWVRRRWPGPAGRWRVTGLALSLGLIVALCLAALPRARQIALGTDPSARARAVYWQAGLEGVAQRPLLGWGAGSVPWTVAEHLRPRLGVNPPGEMVAELHTLPLQVAYEIGIPASALGLTVLGLFALRCRRRWLAAGRPASGSAWLAAGGLGGLGAGVASLATGWWAVAALPAALAVTAGAALTGSASTGSAADRPAVPSRPPGSFGRAARWLVAVGYVAAVTGLLAGPWQAQRAYDVAARSGDPRVVEVGLAEAVARDPDFPWYRLIQVWTAAGVSPDPGDARSALRAAEDGYAVAPLWLVAGAYGADQGEAWAAAALDRACRLDPLGALGPFFRLALEPSPRVARSAGARALLAEPRLAVSTLWEKHPELLAEAVAGVLAADGVDPGWRRELADRVNELGALDGPIVELGLQLEPASSESVPLRIFRRSPWPEVLLPVPLWADAVDDLDLPPATVLPSTAAELFATPDCSLGRVAD